MEESQQLCSSVSTNTEEAIKKLTGQTNLTPTNQLFTNHFENAQKIQNKCPVDMGGAGNLDLLYWCAEYLKASKVIETGVAYGWSSMAILLSLVGRENSRLVSTDMPYPDRNNAEYVGCVVPDEIRNDWKIMRGPDRQSLPKSIDMLESIDMCHYDSDKSYQGRMWAYPKLWESLRPGGFFISDDIGDNMAFFDFAKKIACKPIIVEKDKKYMGIIVKSA